MPDKLIEQEIRNYELWGPFIFSMMFAVGVSFDHLNESVEKIFTIVVILIMAGSIMLVLNSKLLNTKMTFLQSNFN